MEIMEIIKGRRSIRRFHSKSIPQELVEELKEALIWAPSAGNLQARKFYFIYNPEIKKRLVEAALYQHFIAEAPLVVAACVDYSIERYYGRRGRELYCLQDVAASIENMLLLAHARGLGTCWVGAFDEREVTRLLRIPSPLRVVALIPIGYPAENPSPPPRVKIEDAVEEIP